MTMYSIRVELHSASWADYNKLAENLAFHGITDVVTTDDGRRFKMSPAEYNYVGSAAFEQVYQATVNSAKMTGKRFAVMVNQVVYRQWEGLEQLR